MNWKKSKKKLLNTFNISSCENAVSQVNQGGIGIQNNNYHSGIAPQNSFKLVDRELFFNTVLICGGVTIGIGEALIYFNVDGYNIINNIMMFIIFPLVVFAHSCYFNYWDLYIYNNKMISSKDGIEIEFDLSIKYNFQHNFLQYTHEDVKTLNFLKRKNLTSLKDKIDAYKHKKKEKEKTFNTIDVIEEKTFLDSNFYDLILTVAWIGFFISVLKIQMYYNFEENFINHFSAVLIPSALVFYIHQIVKKWSKKLTKN